MYLYSRLRGNQRYWYIRKKERVNGKAVVVLNKYIGTDKQLIERLLNGELKILENLEVQSYVFGTIAALLTADKELGFTSTITQVTGSPSTALVCLAFIAGRSQEPVSKNGMTEWYDRSVLEVLIPRMPSLSCRSYLYHMDKLTDSAEREITFRIAQRMMSLGHKPDTIFFDITNFSTEMQPDLDDVNRQLARPGHPKDFNIQAKLIGLATASSSQHLPVFHEVLPGNWNDVHSFQKIINSMVDHLLKLGVASEDLVFVFDKGVNSEDNWGALAKKEVHFLSSLKRMQVEDLLLKPLESYKKTYTTEQNEEIQTFRVERKVMGISGALVIAYNASSQERQERDYERAKVRFLRKCNEVAAAASKPHRGRKSTVQSITERIEDCLPKKWRCVFKYHVGATLDGGFTKFAVKGWVEKKKERILRAGFGKTIIFTDKKDWDEERIVRTFFARSAMEEDYHILKDVLLMPVMPIFHKLDSRIRVHAFLMVMGLLFYRWIQLRVQEKLKRKVPIDRLMHTLDRIRMVALIDRARKKVKFKLERLSEEEKGLVEALDLSRWVPN